MIIILQNSIINNILYQLEADNTVLLLLKLLGDFNGSNYKLKEQIWENFDWEVEKCVLRSDNNL